MQSADFSLERLTLHYQPVVRQDGSLSSVEALIRLQDPDRGLLPPSTFATALDAEDTARDIGCFVLRTACTQAATWKREQGLQIRMSVNISAQHLLDPDFLRDLETTISDTPGFSADQLEVEITETAPLRDVTRAAQVLTACNALGVRIALDDFGTGNANLTWLQKCPAQTIKIDQSFVRDLQDGSRDRAIIAGLVTSARMLNLFVIAEGVETLHQADALLDMDCDALQGYYFARPMPPHMIPTWRAASFPLSLAG